MRISMGIAALLLLTGCGGSPAAKLTATCTAVMSDPKVGGDITDANISIEAFCGCAATTLLALPDDERGGVISTLETMEQMMQNHEGSAEAAFRELSKAARAEDATPEAITAYESMDALGQRLDDLLEAMRDADRACPA